MSTHTDEGLDTDLLGMLDFDHEVPCDMNRYSDKVPSCEKVAEWKITLSCCGGIMFLCQEHFDALLEAMAEKRFIFTHPTPYGCGRKDIVNPFAAAEKIKA